MQGVDLAKVLASSGIICQPCEWPHFPGLQPRWEVLQPKQSNPIELGLPNPPDL